MEGGLSRRDERNREVVGREGRQRKLGKRRHGVLYLLPSLELWLLEAEHGDPSRPVINTEHSLLGVGWRIDLCLLRPGTSRKATSLFRSIDR